MRSVKAMDTIKIYLTRGEKDEWAKDEWDDYKVAGSLFVVIRDTAWVGVYPLSSVYKIIVK